MFLNSKRLIHVPVRTTSGQSVGKLASFDVDNGTGKMTALHVVPRGTVAGLLSGDLLIEWRFIISLGEDEIVVEDGCVPYAEKRGVRSLAMTSPQQAGSHLKES